MTGVIIFTAKYLYLVSCALFLVYGLITKRKKEFFLLSILVFPISYILALIAGHFFYDPRPFVVFNTIPLFPHTADNGFPSDHALFTGTLAALVTTFNPILGACMWGIALLVGMARVLASVHHTIDIVGAFFIAVISTMMVRKFLSNFRF